MSKEHNEIGTVNLSYEYALELESYKELVFECGGHHRIKKNMIFLNELQTCKSDHSLYTFVENTGFYGQKTMYITKIAGDGEGISNLKNFLENKKQDYEFHVEALKKRINKIERMNIFQFIWFKLKRNKK